MNIPSLAVILLLSPAPNGPGDETPVEGRIVSAALISN